MVLLSSSFIKGLAGILISAVLIAFIAYTVNWSDVIVAINGLSWSLVLLLFLLFLFHFILRAWRWRYLLPASSQGTFRILFDSLAIGNLASFILPLRAGEFIRPAMLSWKGSATFATAFLSVVIERLFDLCTVLLFFYIASTQVKGLPAWTLQAASIFGLLAFVIALFLGVCVFLPSLPVSILALLDRYIARKNRATNKLFLLIEKSLKEILTGAAILRDPVVLVKIILLTLGVWLSIFFFFGVSIYLFNIDIPSIWFGVTLGVIVALAVALPSAPGFIGVYQMACLAAFAVFSLNREVGVAYGIVTHLIQYVFTIGVGGFALVKNGVTLRELIRVR